MRPFRQSISACQNTVLPTTGMKSVQQHLHGLCHLQYPQLAGVALTPSLYKEMLKNPRVIGVKNSSMPVQDIQTFASLGGDNHIVFNGPDEQFLGGRLMGEHMLVSVAPMVLCQKLFLKLNQLIAEKDLETARALQFAINDIIRVLTSAHGNMMGH